MQEFFISIASHLETKDDNVRTAVFELIDDFFNGKVDKDILYKKDICDLLKCDNCCCDEVITIMVKFGMLHQTINGYYPGSIIQRTH